MPPAPVRRPIAILVVLLPLVLAAHADGPGPLRAGADTSLFSARLHFPALPHGGARPVPQPLPTRTPTPLVSPSPSATSAPPTASPSPMPSPTPARPIAFRSTNDGGLPSSPYFQIHISRVPWLTIYEDGGYVRAAELDRHDLVAGQLDDEGLQEVLDRLEHEGGFFDYPNPDHIGACATDGNVTRATLRRDGRSHTIASYMMLWLGLHPDVCPPGSPGMPPGPETDRFYRLARVLASLSAPLTPNEAAYRVEHAIVRSETLAPDPDAAPWPLTRSISDTRGVDTLAPEGYATVMAAVRAHRPHAGAQYAVFRDAAVTAAVGVEVLFED